MKKRVISTIALLLLGALTVYVVSLQSASFTAEGFLDYVHSVKPWGLGAAFACMLGFICFEGMALLVICRALGYSRHFNRGMLYSAADIYMSAITPSATGGQPASALLMMRDGIPAGVTTVTLLMNLIFYTPAILVVALAGVIMYPQAYSLFGVPGRIMILLGILFQVVLEGGYLLLIFHKKVFLAIVDFFLHLGQKLHLVHNAESRREKLLKMEREYHACSKGIRERWRAMLAAFGLNFLQRLSSVMVPVVLYLASGFPAREAYKIFALQSLVILGSNSVPIPGAVGVADYLFIDGYGMLIQDPVNLELLSRTISFYTCILVSILILAIAYFAGRRARK